MSCGRCSPAAGQAASLPVPPGLAEAVHVIAAITRGQQLAHELARAGTSTGCPRAPQQGDRDHPTAPVRRTW
jgi:hypothetical protein